MEHHASILRISDGTHKFPFLLKDNKLYCPDHNPLAFGENPTYKFTVWKWDVQRSEHKEVLYECTFQPHKDAYAIPVFRYESYFYRQAIDVNILDSDMLYVELVPWTNNGPDENYVGAQGWYAKRMPTLSITIIDELDKTTILGFKASVSDIEEYIKYCYGDISSIVQCTAEMALVDENDMYWRAERESFRDGNVFGFNWTSLQFKNHYQFKQDLRLVGVLHVEIETSGERMHLDIKSNPYPLTEEFYARLISGTHENIDITDMNVNKPRIINKSIQNVVTMTSQSDSKANIIQPVFFRSRELAQIIVHPAVTENICINLDAYKSQVERFYIKIEGVVFAEIGRTESGVIFKVKGNLLPNALQAGTYYILNEDTDLVTTGKYKYDF